MWHGLQDSFSLKDLINLILKLYSNPFSYWTTLIFQVALATKYFQGQCLYCMLQLYCIYIYIVYTPCLHSTVWKSFVHVLFFGCGNIYLCKINFSLWFLSECISDIHTLLANHFLIFSISTDKIRYTFWIVSFWSESHVLLLWLLQIATATVRYWNICTMTAQQATFFTKMVGVCVCLIDR